MRPTALSTETEPSRHIAPGAFAGVVAAVCAAFAAWQFADDGLAFVTKELAKNSALVSEVGSVRRAVAYRARYMEDRRDYWVVALGADGWTFRRVEVLYADGMPQHLEVR